MMTSYVWHCFCTYCTKKRQVFITFQHYHVTQRLSGTTVLEARPKVCDQDQDQSCKTKTKTKTEAGLRPVLS